MKMMKAKMILMKMKPKKMKKITKWNCSLFYYPKLNLSWN